MMTPPHPHPSDDANADQGGADDVGAEVSGNTSGNVSGKLMTAPPSVGSSGANATANASNSRLPKWLGRKVAHFKLVSLLGSGSWGKVFEAEDVDLRRRVALKLIDARRSDKTREELLRRVGDEARAAASLEHPHVVQIYEVGESGNAFYIAMELCEGGSVGEMIAAHGRIDAGRACTLAAEAADALAVAHEYGITHRDVKPANLLLTRRGRCKVADFGLAAGGDLSDPLHATRAAGTPHYIAPEIVRGNEADARSDVYSMGMTLYHMLAGHKPLPEGARADVLRHQLHTEPAPLKKAAPGIDPRLADVVHKAIDKDPSLRYESMRQLASALRLFTVAGGQPAAASGPGRTPLLIGAGVAAAAVLGVVALFAFSGGDDPDPTPTPEPAAPAVVETPAVESTPSPTPTPPPVAAGPVEHTFRLNTKGRLRRPSSVYVAGTFNEWNETDTPLSDPDGDGVWEATITTLPGLVEYKFIVDGTWTNDPAADTALNQNDTYGGVNSGVMVE